MAETIGRIEALERHQDRILAELSELRKEIKADTRAVWEKINNQEVSLEKLKSSLTTIQQLLTLILSSGFVLYAIEKFMP